MNFIALCLGECQHITPKTKCNKIHYCPKLAVHICFVSYKRTTNLAFTIRSGSYTCRLLYCVQGLLCGGGRRNACGRRHLPRAGQPSATAFIKSVNLDPLGSGHWHCAESTGRSTSSSDVTTTRRHLNSYTFVGSYYHVYVKLASCSPPSGQSVYPNHSRCGASISSVIWPPHAAK